MKVIDLVNSGNYKDLKAEQPHQQKNMEGLGEDLTRIIQLN